MPALTKFRSQAGKLSRATLRASVLFKMHLLLQYLPNQECLRSRAGWMGASAAPERGAAGWVEHGSGAGMSWGHGVFGWVIWVERGSGAGDETDGLTLAGWSAASEPLAPGFISTGTHAALQRVLRACLPSTCNHLRIRIYGRKGEGLGSGAVGGDGG